MKNEIPQEWQNFMQELRVKIKSLPFTLPITFLPDAWMVQRKDYKTGRPVDWKNKGMDAGQRRLAEFWLLLEILETLTGLPRSKIFDHPAEPSDWPDLTGIDREKWDKAIVLIFQVCREKDDSKPVRIMVSFLESYQYKPKSDKENQDKISGRGNPDFKKIEMPEGFFIKAKKLISEKYPDKASQDTIANELIDAFSELDSSNSATIKRRIKAANLW